MDKNIKCEQSKQQLFWVIVDLNNLSKATESLKWIFNIRFMFLSVKGILRAFSSNISHVYVGLEGMKIFLHGFTAFIVSN